jgi:hypothetical protein
VTIEDSGVEDRRWQTGRKWRMATGRKWRIEDSDGRRTLTPTLSRGQKERGVFQQTVRRKRLPPCKRRIYLFFDKLHLTDYKKTLIIK